MNKIEPRYDFSGRWEMRKENPEEGNMVLLGKGDLFYCFSKIDPNDIEDERVPIQNYGYCLLDETRHNIKLPYSIKNQLLKPLNVSLPPNVEYFIQSERCVNLQQAINSSTEMIKVGQYLLSTLLNYVTNKQDV